MIGNGNIHYGERPPASDKVEQLEIPVESFSSVEMRDLDEADIAVLGEESRQKGQDKKL